jgi:hypothetical protein
MARSGRILRSHPNSNPSIVKRLEKVIIKISEQAAAKQGQSVSHGKKR